MPDTLSRERMTVIRVTHEEHADLSVDCEVCALLAHIDALTAAATDLLDDTEHIDHDCGDTDCPVSRLRAVVGEEPHDA